MSKQQILKWLEEFHKGREITNLTLGKGIITYRVNGSLNFKHYSSIRGTMKYTIEDRDKCINDIQIVLSISKYLLRADNDYLKKLQNKKTKIEKYLKKVGAL